MVDHEDTISTRNTSTTPREQETMRKHVERMHFQEDDVRRTNQKKCTLGLRNKRTTDK